MRIFPVPVPDLGNRSYVVTDGSVAMVIDPPRAVGPVLDVIAERGVRVVYVVETHIHNDYVTGGLALARQTGATYALARAEPVAFEHERRGLVDGDRFAVGALEVEAVATPGHTAHHLSYVVSDGDAVAVFTGGSLLVGAAGRTDLMGSTHTKHLAGQQWASIRRLLAQLPDAAVVHPTHGFGSFCAASPTGSREWTTIEEQRQSNPAAQLDQAPFVKALVAGLGEYPTYYAHMAGLNRAGPTGIDLRAVPELGPGHAVAVAGEGEWVVDVRPRRAFADGHVRGSISAGVDGPIATYIGWTMPWDAPLALLAETAGQLRDARAKLGQIGIDRVVGAGIGSPEVWSFPAPPEQFELKTFGDLKREWREDVTVVDVRRREEWDAGHLAGAVHVPVHRLLELSAALPSGGDLWLHCAAGYRAVLGASLLAREGIRSTPIDDVFGAAGTAGLRIERSD